MATVAEDGQSDGLPTDSDLPTDEDELVRDSEDELEVSWACPHDCVPQGSDLQIRLQANRAMMAKLPKENHRLRVWNSLRDLRKETQKGFRMFDTQICRRMWCLAHFVGKSTLSVLLNSLSDDGPPADGRCHKRIVEQSPQWRDVSRFFWSCWNNLAMHVPVERETIELKTEDLQGDAAMKVKVGTTKCSIPRGAGAEAQNTGSDAENGPPHLGLADVSAPTAEDLASLTGKRFMPHMSIREWHEMYQQWSEMGLEDAASRATFTRVYEGEKWKDHLRLATSVTHGKCNTCERLKLLRKKVQSAHQKQQIEKAHGVHVAMVMKDRKIDGFAEQAAKESLQDTNGLTPPHRQILNWTVDWMDQAKFRVPRNTSMAKVLNSCWRPQLACAGVTIDGLRNSKLLFLAEQDLPKNAETQISVMCRALQAGWSNSVGKKRLVFKKQT